MTRVCVIGAGSSGIPVVKALKEAAVEFDCFEMCSVVGGNWAFGSPWSAAYRTLHINSYCREMQYADFPMPANVSDFPHHEEIAEYFNAYVDHFGLRELITFNTAVERAEPKAAGGWSVHLSTGEARDYDYLVVATGHHHSPRWPEPAFPGHFEGLEMHSHDYRDMSQLSGQDVVVLGMGNSAMDIAVESSYVARHTYLASRRGAYVIPKYLFGRPRLPIPPGCHGRCASWCSSRLYASPSGRSSGTGCPARPIASCKRTRRCPTVCSAGSSMGPSSPNPTSPR